MILNDVRLHSAPGSRCWYQVCCRPPTTRAILAADPETTEEQLSELVAARLERQAILDRPNPPALWVVLDEAVLHRLIGSRKVMHDQLLQLAHASVRNNMTVQIVPTEVGAHAGLMGGFALATFDSEPGTVYMESPDQGQTTQLPTVSSVSRAPSTR